MTMKEKPNVNCPFSPSHSVRSLCNLNDKSFEVYDRQRCFSDIILVRCGPPYLQVLLTGSSCSSAAAAVTAATEVSDRRPGCKDR